MTKSILELRKEALERDKRLAPCQSCGQSAATILVEYSKSSPETILFKVRCGGCDMQTGHYEQMDTAIQRWDARA